MTDDADGFPGQAGLTSGNNARNTDHFQSRQHAGEVRTMIPVKVVKVYGGGIGPDPTVDVQVMVDQADGQGNATPHGTIYGIAAPRNQSGNGVVINDPVVGDLGYMHICDRDLSAFRAANRQASPGSKRRHSLSDGVYVRGHNGKGTPQQYVHFREDGVTVMDVNGHQFSSSKDKLFAAPKEGSGAMVHLGGDGTKGSYDFALTANGPSQNVKLRIS